MNVIKYFLLVFIIIISSACKEESDNMDVKNESTVWRFAVVGSVC